MIFSGEFASISRRDADEADDGDKRGLTEAQKLIVVEYICQEEIWPTWRPKKKELAVEVRNSTLFLSYSRVLLYPAGREA